MPYIIHREVPRSPRKNPPPSPSRSLRSSFHRPRGSSGHKSRLKRHLKISFRPKDIPLPPPTSDERQRSSSRPSSPYLQARDIPLPPLTSDERQPSLGRSLKPYPQLQPPSPPAIPSPHLSPSISELRQPSPRALANLYTYLLVDAKPITILSDPSGIPGPHVELLRACLQTFSDRRTIILNLQDAACNTCIKEFKEMHWIRRTYDRRSRSFRMGMERFKKNKIKERNTIKKRNPLTKCDHNHKLRNFSKAVLPSNCARIHNLLIQTSRSRPMDIWVLKSAVNNICNYLPNLKTITLENRLRGHDQNGAFRESGTAASKHIFEVNPGRHVREASLIGDRPGIAPIIGLKASSIPSWESDGEGQDLELPIMLETASIHKGILSRSSPMKTKFGLGIKSLVGNLEREEKKEIMNCFILLEQELPVKGRLKFEGQELYPGMRGDWKKQRRRWYE